MQKILFFLTFIILSSTTKAQSAEDSVKAVINKLFAAFKNSDAISMKSTFADNAIMQTFLIKDGTTVIENETVEEFAKNISRIPKGDADEQIVFDVIKINGPLAMVWAPYKFYYKGTFSHCGVDSFQLVKINGEWKIQYLVDTRTKTGCN